MINKKMSKFFIIVITGGMVFLIAIAVAVALPSKVQLPAQNSNLPVVSEASKTSVAYGVKMLDKCFAKFQDFIKNYGADYSKCLANFDFNNEYCGAFNLNTQSLSDANVIVILDSSGSMAEKIGPDTKMSIAKKAVSDFLSKMPQIVNIGLIVYGDKGSNSPADKNLSCQGIEEVVKLGKNNSSNVITAMNSFGPRGWTPIAGAFDFAKNIFLSKGAKDKDYLILVSDGVESCNGDPLSAAADLKSKVSDIKLSVIGFATDNTTQGFLKKIASHGGGSFLTANTSSGIAKAFNDQLLLIEKDCIDTTIFKLSSDYKTNNWNNLSCWLAAQKKESDDFVANVEEKSTYAECNLEVRDALVARQIDFWYKKQAVEEQNNAIFNKTESDLDNKLKSF